MSRVLVIGASGKTGQHVVTGLVSKGVRVRAGSRSPEQLPVTGADRARFDWHDESTWDSALDGVVATYLVKPESPDVVQVVDRFLTALTAAGANRVVLLSECAAQTRHDDRPERAVERLVESSALEWTILRPSWFMQDIVDDEFFGAMVRQDRKLIMTTGGSATAWIDARDIASVAVEVLLGGRGTRQSLDLTGPEGLTLAQLGERITAATGVPVEAIEESLSEAERRMRADGLPESFIVYMTQVAESIIAGHTAEVTGHVERLTGQPPRTIDAFLAENQQQLTPLTKDDPR